MTTPSFLQTLPLCNGKYRYAAAGVSCNCDELSVVGGCAITTRLVPIMLLKSPIMLWINALEFYLLCSIDAPYFKHYSLQIQCFISLILLMSISSLSSSSTVQHTINNSSMDVYKHTLNSFLLHFQLYLIQGLTKSLPQVHLNLTIL